MLQVPVQVDQGVVASVVVTVIALHQRLRCSSLLHPRSPRPTMPCQRTSYLAVRVISDPTSASQPHSDPSCCWTLSVPVKWPLWRGRSSISLDSCLRHFSRRSTGHRIYHSLSTECTILFTDSTSLTDNLTSKPKSNHPFFKCLQPFHHIPLKLHMHSCIQTTHCSESLRSSDRETFRDAELYRLYSPANLICELCRNMYGLGWVT